MNKPDANVKSVIDMFDPLRTVLFGILEAEQQAWANSQALLREAIFTSADHAVLSDNRILTRLATVAERVNNLKASNMRTLVEIYASVRDRPNAGLDNYATAIAGMLAELSFQRVLFDHDLTVTHACAQAEWEAQQEILKAEAAKQSGGAAEESARG